jgi:hypothetical protein
VSLVRRCLYCGEEDTHPKHETIHPGMVSVYAHMDCCAQATGCAVCAPVVEAANGKRGEDLRDFILNGRG